MEIKYVVKSNTPHSHAEDDSKPIVLTPDLESAIAAIAIDYAANKELSVTYRIDTPSGNTVHEILIDINHWNNLQQMKYFALPF